jgi:hypothetical protein
MRATRTYRSLDPDKVVETIGQLRHRIVERFPGAGLGEVCAELLLLAGENSARAEKIARRNIPLRIAIFVLLVAGTAALAWIVRLFMTYPTAVDNVFNVLQGVDGAANLIVLMGAGVFFLTRIEERLKRRQALQELRSIVHVIDMHQLTKDPSAVVSIAGNTASSPPRTLSRFEVTRYLDYCSEMLSLTAKVAVLFAQVFPDATVTETVSDIERIAAGLSQKIWQKIMILETVAEAGDKK